MARPALFALAATALVTAALTLGDHLPDTQGRHQARTPPIPAPTSEDLPPRRLPSLRRGLSRLEADARRFLSAFGAYEVGDLSPKVSTSLRLGTTEAFGAQLLSEPPRLPSGALAEAKLLRLEITPLPQPLTAMVSGTRRRRGSTESFSFRFSRHGDGWLASGVGE